MGATFFPIVNLLESTDSNEAKIERLRLLDEMCGMGMMRRAWKVLDFRGDYLTGIWYALEDVPYDGAFDIVSGIVANGGNFSENPS